MGNLKDYAENFITAKKEIIEPEFFVIDPQREYRSLRINHNTIIQVPPEKCNEEYANQYRERIKSKQY